MNMVTLVGRLTRDASLKYTTGGTAVTNMNIAIDKNMSKEKKEEYKKAGKDTAAFPLVVTYGKAAEAHAKHLGKGSLVSVVAYIDTNKYEDSSGKTRYSTVFVATRIEYLDTKKIGQRSSDDNFSMPGMTEEEMKAIEAKDDIPF